ncbi:MAG TPA: bifunctional precorrin-2 dehydrogenase/sirohydrochlorin ferrochelatase [Nitrospirota bacterium]|nr:bifunctional precorrin-2 dehydrogenase/sirohydrochlorin ferrochelatase [Nitrospirota bacterium]
MKYYPIYLNLRDRPCLIVGGGHVAERKTLSLIEAGANVTVISPSLTQKLQELTQSGKIIHQQKTFDDRDLTDALLVIAATDSQEVNASIGRLCKKRNILVNVVTPPDESSFIVPSVVERGELLIAVSTSGISPALSKRIRQELEERYGLEYEVFLGKMSMLRARLMDEVRDEGVRREILKALADSDVISLLKEGKIHDADHRVAEIVRLKQK